MVSANAGRRSAFLRNTLLPLILMLTTPPLVVLFWLASTRYGGSLARLIGAGLPQLRAAWPSVTARAVGIVLAFIAFEALLLWALPGAAHEGPVTPAGARPRYRLNGLAAFLASHAAFLLGAGPLGLFPATVAYDHWGEILATLTWIALAVCALLYVKGRVAPSGPDHGTSGGLVMDFYWGVELHPRLGPLDLKQLTNCRVGMMGWSVALDSFVAHQLAATGAVSWALLASFVLQQVYIFKFFWWEAGYFGSLDMMHDRAGYYIVWGVLVWIPGVYLLCGLYLADHAPALSPWTALVLVVVGLAAIAGNYDADAQRQRVRATGGDTLVWGRRPEVMVARWTSADGEPRTSLLLLSGWWGMARHVHYLTELALALCWTLPAGFAHFLPYTYFVFLTVLLFHRSSRDELRCRAKYGDDWIEYVRRVPWRVIPGVY